MREPGNEKTDAIGMAKKRGKTEMVSLLEKFKANPTQTGNEIRLEMTAAEMFSLVIFLCNGLLQIKPNQELDKTCMQVLQYSQSTTH